MYTLEFELRGLTMMANQMLRGHWRVKHAHAVKWKKAVARAIENHAKPHSPLAFAALSLTRVSSVEPDFDGLVSGFKPVIDALTELGIIASDKMSCIGQPRYQWERGKPGLGSMRIKVIETLTSNEEKRNVLTMD